MGSIGPKIKGKFIQNALNLLIHFGEKLDQLYVLVSRELNVIETNRFFLQKEGVHRIVVRYKQGANRIENPPKRGSSQRNLPTMPNYGSTPPPSAHLQGYERCVQVLVSFRWRIVLEATVAVTECTRLMNHMLIVDMQEFCHCEGHHVREGNLSASHTTRFAVSIRVCYLCHNIKCVNTALWCVDQ